MREKRENGFLFVECSLRTGLWTTYERATLFRFGILKQGNMLVIGEHLARIFGFKVVSEVQGKRMRLTFTGTACSPTKAIKES